MAASELDKHRRRWEENPKGLTFAPYADALRKSGAAEEALSVLRAGLEFHPDYLPANIVLGRTYLDLGDDLSAESAFGRVLELDPENVIALKALADVCERAARWDDAERWLGLLLGVDRWNDGAREQMLRVQEARTAMPAEPAEVHAGAQPADAAMAGEPETLDSPSTEPVGAEASLSAAVMAAPETAEIELAPTAFEAPSVGERADVVPDGFEAVTAVTDGGAIDAVTPLAGLVSSAYQAEPLPSPLDAPEVVGETSVEVDLGVDETAILSPTSGATEFAVDDAAASLGASLADEPVAEVLLDAQDADIPDWSEIGSGEFVPAMFAEEAPSVEDAVVVEAVDVVIAEGDDAPVEFEGTAVGSEEHVEFEEHVDSVATSVEPEPASDMVEEPVALESTADIEPLAVVLADAAAADLALPDLDAPVDSFAPIEAFTMATVIAEPVSAPEPASRATEPEETVVVAAPMASVEAAAEPVAVAPEPSEPWECCDWSAEPSVAVDADLLASLGPKVSVPQVIAPKPEPIADTVEIVDPWQCADWTSEPEVQVDDAVIAALGPVRAAVAPPVPVVEAAAPALEPVAEVTAHPEVAVAEAPSDVQETLVAEPEDDTAAAPPDFAAPVLVTAAMAMLYESQGHHGDALRVYRELEEREPGAHAARIAELEARVAASVPAPPVFAARATGGRSVREFLQGVIRGAPAALLAPRTLPSEGPALRRAEDDVSLGRIFGEEAGGTATAARPLSVAARPQASMDEFYGGAPSTTSSSDDLEQFHAWLQGLKT